MTNKFIRSKPMRLLCFSRFFWIMSSTLALTGLRVFAEDDNALPPIPKIIQAVGFRTGSELWTLQIESNGKGQVEMGAPFCGNPGFNPEYRGRCQLVWLVQREKTEKKGSIDLGECFFVFLENKWTVHGAPPLEVRLRGSEKPPIVAFRQYASSNGEIWSFFLPVGQWPNRKLSKIRFSNVDGLKTFGLFGSGWYWGKLRRKEGIFWGDSVDEIGEYLFVEGYDNAQWGYFVKQYAENDKGIGYPLVMKQVGFYSSERVSPKVSENKDEPALELPGPGISQDFDWAIQPVSYRTKKERLELFLRDLDPGPDSGDWEDASHVYAVKTAKCHLLQCYYHLGEFEKADLMLKEILKMVLE